MKKQQILSYAHFLAQNHQLSTVFGGYNGPDFSNNSFNYPLFIKVQPQENKCQMVRVNFELSPFSTHSFITILRPSFYFHHTKSDI